MYNKNDPLVNSVKAIMEQNDLRRRVEAKLCEELGIYSRKQLPREHVANYDALLEQRVKEELVGNQHKIDANKNNRVDAHDFKLLRAKKEAMKEEDKSSSDPDFAAPADPRAPKYKDEIKYKEEPKATMPKNPPMPPRRPPNLEETSHMKKLDELSLDKMNAAKKEAEKRKGMAEKGTSPVDKKYAERYGKYVELAKRRMKSKMDEEALEEKATPAQQKKVEKVMGEFKKGELHSGSKKGPEVTSRKQAVAIALSQAGLSKKKVDEDFDLEAVMEELRANLGEERVDEIVDWFRNRMAGTKPQSPTAAQSMAANPPPTRQSGREGGEQIASALSRSAERGYGDTGAARRASGASLASQPEPGYTGSAARRVSGAALASQPEPGRSSAAQPERQNMTSITAGIANRVNSRPSTTQTASSPAATAPAPSPAATAPAPSPAATAPAPSPAATAPASRPAAPAARPTPSPAARPAAPAPEPRSRQMFQAAQDREDRGEAGGSAAFFAADKQRTAELRGMQESKSLTSTINKVLKG